MNALFVFAGANPEMHWAAINFLMCVVVMSEKAVAAFITPLLAQTKLNLATEPHNLPSLPSRIRKCWSLLKHDIIITNNSWPIYLSMLIVI